MPTPLLQVEGIEKAYGGVKALHGADLSVAAGEVHALLGENGAGKSTLMKIVAGSVIPDAGTVAVAGQPVSLQSAQDARAAGVSIVHQELSLVAELSVAENVLLGRWPRRRRLVSRRRTEREARPHLERVGLDVDPGRPVGALGSGERQLVELAKALSTDARIVLLDEPTSALSEPEVRRLFVLIGELKRSGVAIVYVSHRLDEVLEIADRVTVLRDGRNAGTAVGATTDETELVRMMIGHELPTGPPVRTSRRATGEVVLRASGFSSLPRLKPIDLELARGEIIAVFGLVGAGRSRLARALFGLEPATQGTLELFGRAVSIRSSRDAIAAGMGYVGEDRAGGLIPRMSVGANITLASIDKVARGPLLDRAAEERMARRFLQELSIRASSPAQPVSALSGGNQQKVLLARWYASGSRILLLDDPTRGIDVGAKEEVFRLLRRLRDDGLSTLYLTSEMKEARMIADRLLVMANGRIVKSTTPDAPDAEVMAAAGGIVDD